MSHRASLRAAWAVVALTTLLFVAAAVLGWLTRSVHHDIDWGGGGLVASLVWLLTLFAFPVVGLLICARRPGNAIGWLLLAIGLSWSIATTSPYADYGLVLHPGSLPAAAAVAAIGSPQWILAIGLTGTFLILLFPDGRLPGPRWRWVAWLSAFGIVVGFVAAVVKPGPLTDADYPATNNPLGIDALSAVIDIATLAFVVLPVAMVASAVSLVVRYRRSHGVERVQLRWLTAAAASVAVIYLIAVTASVLVTPSARTGPVWLQTLETGATVSFSLIPIAIGFAVLRHRLYGIDLIIRRTVLYAALALVLGALYLGCVSLLGIVLGTLTGRSDAVAVTVATLVAAAAFQPLRKRAQRALDRRFYRAKYDAQAAVEALTRTLRQQVDLDAVEHEVLAVVARTVRPAHAELWLRRREDRA